MLPTPRSPSEHSRPQDELAFTATSWDSASRCSCRSITPSFSHRRWSPLHQPISRDRRWRRLTGEQRHWNNLRRLTRSRTGDSDRLANHTGWASTLQASPGGSAETRRLVRKPRGGCRPGRLSKLVFEEEVTTGYFPQLPGR